MIYHNVVLGENKREKEKETGREEKEHLCAHMKAHSSGSEPSQCCDPLLQFPMVW